METPRQHPHPHAAPLDDEEDDDDEEDEDFTEVSTATTPFFFADATLDLDTAHDIAETPDARHHTALRKHHHHHHAAVVPTSSFLNTRATTTKHAQQQQLHQTPLAASSTVTPAFLDFTTELLLPIEESGKSEFARISSSLEMESSIPPPKHRPKWPRDVSWAVAFLLIVPAGIIWPICLEEQQEHFTNKTTSPLVRPPLSTATLHALGWASLVAFFASRYFYRTAAGPDGEDARYQIGQVLQAATALSVMVYATLGLVVWVWLPSCPVWFTLVPAWFTLSHILLLKQWRRRGDRQAFFQALASMALDILTKSLRRSSFFRVLSVLLVVQTMILFFWRWALLGALGSHSWFFLLWAILAGKWATGTVARLLSFLASGGVYSWFVEQSAAVAALPNISRTTRDDTDGEDGSSNQKTTNEEQDDMPEAYRSADGSVYQSVLEVDDGLSDDDDDDDQTEQEDFWETPSNRRGLPNNNNNNHGEQKFKSTVLSLLVAGLTVSFGSVVQCGLLGGLAQFVWSQLRKLQAAQSVWARLREARSGGMSSMPIGSAAGAGAGGGSSGNERYYYWKKLWLQGLSTSRQFVRNHSDLAMAHVAAYSKHYHKAAKDVAAVVDRSGVEPILHDDITTHMCSAVGGSASGIICLFTGYILLEQRRLSGSSSSMMVTSVTDVQVFQDMLLAFVLCYTLIFTVMEPLRASIKAVYVSFAQHPQSLSQAYPLIYARLRRLSESNALS